MKKTIKYLSLFLALLMLCLAFVSCNANEVPVDDATTDTEAETEQAIPEGALSVEEIKKLVIIRSADANEEELAAINLLKKELKSVFGATTKIITDKNDADKDAIPLIIGNTNKKPSSTAIKKLKGAFGYVYGHLDGNIVINAEYSYYLLEAINTFIDEYVKEGATYLALPKDIVVVETKAHLVAENGKSNYGVVCGKAYEENFNLFQNKLAMYTGAKLVNTSKMNAAAVELEVLIGDTGRPESAQALDLIGYDESIITVINNKIVVRGWYETTTEKALERFMALLDIFNNKDSKKVFIPSDYKEILTTTSVFHKDIPTYVGGKITAAQDVGQNNFLFYVKDTNLQEFEAYKTLLSNSGYTLYTQYNDLNGVKSATFKSEKTMIHTYYITNENAVRIVTAPMSSTTLTPVVNAPTVEKKTDSSITQVMLDYYDIAQRSDGNFGNCYVIRLDDGSLLVYDGGATYSDADAERLWGVMQEQAIKQNGKVVVAGWILTHEHGDHYGNMNKVLNKYGSQIKVENFYCQEVTDIVGKLGGSNPSYINGSSMSTAMGLTGFKMVRMHTGQRFWIRNAMIEVLYSPEDMYPNGIKNYEEYADFNDTSVVTRITIDGTTMMNLGDVYAVGSKILVDTYGNELKSDLSTIAHHGWGGASIPLYTCINAEKYFFPFAQWRFETILNDDRKYTQWAVDQYTAYPYTVSDVLRHVVNQVGQTNIIIADHYNKEVVFKDKGVDSDNFTVIYQETNNMRSATSKYSERYPDREVYKDANKR